MEVLYAHVLFARTGIIIHLDGINMRITNFILVFGLLGAVSAQQTVYLIRHGEKPADGGNGLSAQGVDRAQCLRSVFGNSSAYDIGYIIAEQPKDSKICCAALMHSRSEDLIIRMLTQVQVGSVLVLC